MKKQTKPLQRPHKFEVLRQICNLIPNFVVAKVARRTGVDKKARTFTPWSHVVAMLYAQLTHAIGLNDVCDALKLLSGPLSAKRRMYIVDSTVIRLVANCMSWAKHRRRKAATKLHMRLDLQSCCRASRLWTWHLIMST